MQSPEKPQASARGVVTNGNGHPTPMAGQVWKRSHLYHPRTLPAPLGRGIDGWPLISCYRCSRPIRWVRDKDGCWESPAVYYERRFCGRTCLLAWAQTMLPKYPESRAPVDLRPGGHLTGCCSHSAGPLRPLMAEIQRCRHCGSPALRDFGPGRECLMCGATMFARDGLYVMDRQEVVATERR